MEQINLLTRRKVRVMGYASHLLEPDRHMVVYTDIGVLVARNHPEHPQWYATQGGRFFHLTAKGFHQITPAFSPAQARGFTAAHPTSGGKTGGCYPKLRQLNDKHCHHFMWEVWKGPRTPDMEIDHLSGNKLDWSIWNLEEVTREENRRRARILRILRSIGRNPENMTYAELQSIFEHYSFKDQEPRAKSREPNLTPTLSQGEGASPLRGDGREVSRAKS